MTKAELIAALAEYPDDADVYYSTGSTMDDTIGSQYEVDHVYSEYMTFGLLLPKEKQTTKECIVLEGC